MLLHFSSASMTYLSYPHSLKSLSSPLFKSSSQSISVLSAVPNTAKSECLNCKVERVHSASFFSVCSARSGNSTHISRISKVYPEMHFAFQVQISTYTLYSLTTTSTSLSTSTFDRASSRILSLSTSIFVSTSAALTCGVPGVVLHLSPFLHLDSCTQIESLELVKHQQLLL